MSRSELADIYREAAEMIDAGEWFGCCSAIYECCEKRHGENTFSSERVYLDAITRFGNYFYPGGRSVDYGRYWWRICDDQARVLALLLMADIVESEYALGT